MNLKPNRPNEEEWEDIGEPREIEQDYGKEKVEEK